YLFAFTLLISFAACKKEAANNNNDEITTHSDDQSQFSTEIDAVANDADVAIESTSSFSGRYQGIQGIICDATVAVAANSNPNTITVTYDGTNCLGGFHTRSGVVIISMPQGV